MKKFLPLILVAAVSACGTPPAEITQAPVAYNVKEAISTAGKTSFVARSYVKTSDKKSQEVVGATCRFENYAVRSTFQTPAIVLAPNMGTLTPAAEVKCQHGDKEGFALLSPYNKTVADINANARNAAAGQGILGAVVSGVVAGVQKSKRNAAADVFAYSDTTVDLR